MPYPRPILKRFAASSDDSDSPNSREGGLMRIDTRSNKVHFPNHPDALTRTHLAYSPDVYDRSPIAIRPNTCALPERGCPGRTYSDDTQENMDVDDGDIRSRSSPVRLKRGDHQHPCARVVAFLKNGDSSDSSSSPSLIQDLSDTSEDSDNMYTAPFFNDTHSSSSLSHNRRFSAASSSSSLAPTSHSPRLSPKAGPAQLAFLPHPHSSPYSGERSPTSFHPPGSPTRESRSVRRTPSSPSRQRQRSRSRVRGSQVRDRNGTGNKQRMYDQEDEGCLGGF